MLLLAPQQFSGTVWGADVKFDASTDAPIFKIWGATMLTLSVVQYFVVTQTTNGEQKSYLLHTLPVWPLGIYSLFSGGTAALTLMPVVVNSVLLALGVYAYVTDAVGREHEASHHDVLTKCSLYALSLYALLNSLGYLFATDFMLRARNTFSTVTVVGKAALFNYAVTVLLIGAMYCWAARSLHGVRQKKFLLYFNIVVIFQTAIIALSKFYTDVGVASFWVLIVYVSHSGK